MSELMSGRCLNCGGPTYDQSYCDDCSDDSNEDGLFKCPQCEDREKNLYSEDEPIRDCYDHIDKWDIADAAREFQRKIASMGKEMDNLRRERHHLRNIVGRLLFLTGEFGALMASLGQNNITILDAIKKATKLLEETTEITKEADDGKEAKNSTSH